MSSEDLRYDPDACRQCGDCFARCAYLGLTREEAVAQIGELRTGGPARKVMKGCISCSACDVFCPNGAHPYQLILQRWDIRYRERGLPVRSAYMMPYSGPNYRSDMVAEMDARERELLEQWQNREPAGEVLYPGCNLLTVPYLFDLPILERLPVAGSWDVCCGEPWYRIGAFDAMREIAEKLTRYYADKPIKTMVFPCPACLNMFQHILPGKFGARFDFKCEYLGNWILREMNAGWIEAKRPLGRTVTLHDSCHGRVMGESIMETTREVYRRLGVEIVESPRNREDGLCCGIAAGCNRQMPQDIVKAGRRQLREGREAGTGEMAVYCTGSYLHLGMVQHLTRRTGRQRLVHTLELLGESVDQPMPRKLEERTAHMLRNIARKPLPKLLSMKRYRLNLPDSR